MSDPSTAAYRLLTLIALSGECSPDVIPRLGIGPSYGEKLLTRLKEDNLIKTHYKDRLRGLRLTCDGKRMLLSENPERFSFYLNGSSDTNHPRSDYPRRLRLQQSSIVYAMLLNSGVRLFRDQKPLLFQEEYQCRHGEPIHMELPVFYHSREVKELGTETVKIGNSRIMGILFARDCIYALFYTGDAPMKWEYRTELRVKPFLSYHASRGFLSKGHASPCYQPDTPVKAVLIGSGMDTPLKLMESTGGFQKSCFYLDNSFDYFHYIPDDAAGETMLRLLCSPALQKALRDLLLSDLPRLRAGTGRRSGRAAGAARL